jgi:hypothetical protein
MEIQKPEHFVQVITNEWPTGLHSLDDAAREIGISSERLRGLADGGYAPHYRIDGGPPQFRFAELKRWAALNLMQHVEGKKLPSSVRVVVEAPRVQDFRRVPTSLREVIGLCDITDQLRRIGIYFLCRDGAVVYVGQSVNVATRTNEHMKNQALLNFEWVKPRGG